MLRFDEGIVRLSIVNNRDRARLLVPSGARFALWCIPLATQRACALTERRRILMQLKYCPGHQVLNAGARVQIVSRLFFAPQTNFREAFLHLSC